MHRNFSTQDTLAAAEAAAAGGRVNVWPLNLSHWIMILNVRRRRAEKLESIKNRKFRCLVVKLLQLNWCSTGWLVVAGLLIIWDGDHLENETLNRYNVPTCGFCYSFVAHLQQVIRSYSSSSSTRWVHHSA